jgi:hypothetical protein
MEFLYFVIYISVIIALVLWYTHIIKKESGKDKLSWKAHIVVYLAAFGTPGIILSILAILIKLAYVIFL